MTNPTSRFIRACLRQPVDRTPVWFLRQAGRYMPEYMAIRKHHSLLEICRTPDVAAEVTITAAERLGVDAAIIFADLLLPFTPMGVDFEFLAEKGPVVHTPIRTLEQIQALRTDRAEDLSYVARAIEKVTKHFAALREDGDQLGIIGFCGAPFTLASYMIEGGSSRNYIESKKMMYSDSAPGLSDGELLTILTAFASNKSKLAPTSSRSSTPGPEPSPSPTTANTSWGPTTELVKRVRAMGVPVIYFGVDTASLLPTFRETGADVIGLDWRIPLDEGWRAVGPGCAVQGNLDPITLSRRKTSSTHGLKRSSPWPTIARPHLQPRPRHRPGTPVENVIQVVRWLKESAL